MKKYETPVISVTEFKQDEMIMASSLTAKNPSPGVQSTFEKLTIDF